MENLGLSILFLSIAALLPVIASIFFFLLNKYTKFGKLGFWPKQIIYGILFGALAILGTHWGIPFEHAPANARDAAVITAGLMWGWPAGLIAGFIGAFERFFGVYWFGLGSFTQIACSVSTLVAGIASALLRKFLFDNKRPSLIRALALSFAIEVFHLLMVFVTNASDYKKAFEVVNSCTLPMLLANSISVMLACFALNILEYKKEAFKPKGLFSLNNRLQTRLLGLVAVAFILSSAFIVIFQNEMSNQQTYKTLTRSIDDIANEVQDNANDRILDITIDIRKNYQSDPESITNEILANWANNYSVTEINIVNNVGIIEKSNLIELVHWDFHNKGDQAEEFLKLLPETPEEERVTYITQKYGLISDPDRPGVYRKYCGLKMTLSSGGFVQVGYNTAQYHDELKTLSSGVTSNTHVGEDGFISIIDPQNYLVSCRSDVDRKVILPQLLKLNNDYRLGIYKANTVFKTSLSVLLTSSTTGKAVTEDYYFYIVSVEGYTIFANLTVEGADLSRNIAIYVNTFLEIIVYALVFTLISLSIKLIVNNKIDHINSDLSEITEGNLNVVVDGGKTTEFKELAKDINLTVSRLKEYIKEAASRIDKDLAQAKEIQASVLPNTFPAFPGRDDFDIHAFMQPAKEVGGDFYDFYLTHHNVLNINIADVSGKGIPAAMFMMRAKTELKSLTSTDLSLEKVFEECNNHLVAGNENNMFVTSWQGKIDLKTGILHYVNAGHNPPLIKHKDGTFEFLRSKPNMVLGSFEGLKYTLNTYKLIPGDIIFLYTDGVTESIDTKIHQYTEERLQKTLNSKDWKSCKQICDTVYKNVVKFTKGKEQFDDITMLALKYNGQNANMTQIKFASASLGDIITITDFINNELTKINAPTKVIKSIDIAIDEIYSNIIKYAYPNSAGPTRVEMLWDEKNRMVSITFRDYGPQFNPLTTEAPNVDLPAELRAVGGLGIFVIKRMMTDIKYVHEKGANNLTIYKKIDE